MRESKWPFVREESDVDSCLSVGTVLLLGGYIALAEFSSTPVRPSPKEVSDPARRFLPTRPRQSDRPLAHEFLTILGGEHGPQGSLGKTALVFEPNRGQSNPNVKFWRASRL